MVCKSTLTFPIMYMYLSPLNLKSCAGSDIVLGNLIIFGRDIYQSNRSVTSEKDNFCSVDFLAISPEVEIVCRP